MPNSPVALADELTAVHEDLARDIDKWLKAGGGLDDGLADRIELQALWQQRIYRKLARDTSLAKATLKRKSGTLRRITGANFRAGNGLASGLTPLEPPIKLKTSKPESPHRLRTLHKLAGKRFGIPWEILAAINLVETRFGRILGPSSAGALGPMQFLPSTWAQYGRGGDIMDSRDSIMGAARYLGASGGRTNIRDALYRYNNSDAYVDAVRFYASVINYDPTTYYSYYYWQVFVRTTKGDVQLTGPGADL